MPPIMGIMASAISGNLSSYESIATTTLTSGQTTITFSSIPSTYTHLQLRVSALTPNWMTLTCNGVTSSGNYFGHELRGDGASAISQSLISYNTAYAWIALSYNSTTPTVSVIDVLDYADTNKYKTIRSLSGNDINGGGFIQLTSNAFASTNAISSISITSSSTNFLTNSSFALYGIKG